MATPPVRPSRPAPISPYLTDFEQFVANPQFAAEEKPGMQDWQGGDLPFIPAEGNLQQPGLPRELQALINHPWRRATPRGPRMGGVTMGKPVLNWAKQQGMIQEQPYFKQVAPLHSPASPIQSATTALREKPEWKKIGELQRVNAYTFRGDRRPPMEIGKAGGFQPPITRTDSQYVEGTIYKQFAHYMNQRFGVEVPKDEFLRAYAQTVTQPSDRDLIRSYLSWAGLVQGESYHLGIMLAQEDLKAYISTTRAVTVAKGFAASGADGYVYVTRVVGGFLIPGRGAHAWTELYGEQEIAHLGPVAWSEVFAFRQVGRKSAKFTGPLSIRKGLLKSNPAAYQEIFALLSGKKQTGVRG